MKKVTSKDELKEMIVELIKEQLNMQQNFQQGQKQGVAAGQATKQAVIKGANELSRIGKEVVVTIGGVGFKIVTIGIGAAAYTVWAIGSGIWKIATVTSNAIIKFVSSIVKVSIGGAVALGAATLELFKKAGIEIYKGGQSFLNGVKNLADKSAAVVKWFLGLCKKFGDKVYAQVLAGAASVSAIANSVGNWLGQQWTAIQKNVGIGWEEAKKFGKNVWSGIKSGAKSVGSAIGSAINYGSKLAGNVGGFVQGLFEIFQRFNSFTANTTLEVLKEARYINATIL